MMLFHWEGILKKIHLHLLSLISFLWNTYLHFSCLPLHQFHLHLLQLVQLPLEVHQVEAHFQEAPALVLLHQLWHVQLVLHVVVDQLVDSMWQLNHLSLFHSVFLIHGLSSSTKETSLIYTSIKRIAERSGSLTLVYSQSLTERVKQRHLFFTLSLREILFFHLFHIWKVTLFFPHSSGIHSMPWSLSE